jgi:hypothetical protein
MMLAELAMRRVLRRGFDQAWHEFMRDYRWHYANSGYRAADQFAHRYAAALLQRAWRFTSSKVSWTASNNLRSFSPCPVPKPVNAQELTHDDNP